MLAGDDSALNAIDLSAGPEWLLVERTANGVEVLPLAETEWRFAAALYAGETFVRAIEAVPNADVATLFARHLAAGRFIGFRLAEDHPSAPLEKTP